MAILSKTAILLALTLTAGFGVSQAFAAAKPTTKTISTLDGKFSFKLAKGYVADPLPAGDAEHGTAGATGTMYSDQASKSVVFVVEKPSTSGNDTDPQFLDGAVADFVKEQSAALPDFKKVSEKKLTLKGLAARQVDSTATMGGGKTLSSTFLTGAGSHQLVIQAISRADDQKGHAALVKQITGAK